MNDHLLRLVSHMRWADDLVAESLSKNAEPESVRLFAHIASVEHLWYARIHGATPKHPVWPTLSVTDAAVLASEHASLFEGLVSGETATDLSRLVAYRNSAGRDFVSSVVDIVIHTTMHGEHHRGQIARLLRAAGQEPPYTDYIQFSRRSQ
jgi:uncharacterized damage-inducible protein DinB